MFQSQGTELVTSKFSINRGNAVFGVAFSIRNGFKKNIRHSRVMPSGTCHQKEEAVLNFFLRRFDDRCFATFATNCR